MQAGCKGPQVSAFLRTGYSVYADRLITSTNSKVMKRKSRARKTKLPLKRGRMRNRVRAKESEEIVLAIRRGKIDALVTLGTKGEQVLTLQGAEHPYRVLVESINDGVATLDPAGVVLYANT